MRTNNSLEFSPNLVCQMIFSKWGLRHVHSSVEYINLIANTICPNKLCEKSMIIVIFGGGGFIGAAIADRLLAEGHSLRIFERPRVQPYRNFAATETVDWIAGDISSTHDVNDAICGVDAVLHLVSTTLPKSSNDDPIFDVQSNIVGSLHILNAMVHYGVKNLVFISSGGTVYGNPLYLPVDEKTRHQSCCVVWRHKVGDRKISAGL